MSGPLAPFGTATRTWFEQAFPDGPTPAQVQAWESISQGLDTLVVAPTGSGKTLSAFLWALDRLSHSPTPEDRAKRCRVLYVSPLKALAADVERNLRRPLRGITEAGEGLSPVTVGIRTGDTPARERRRLATHPPDVLITTPESLFLVLTSKAREGLTGVETVIVDEVHALAGTKRGAHLALSLERLDALLGRRAQRIGLSATVRPREMVAEYLGGARVVAPPDTPRMDLRVEVPVRNLDEPDGAMGGGSVWPRVERRVLDLVRAHRSTIVFANGRRTAEKLCARLNDLHVERSGGDLPEEGVAAQVMGRSGQSQGAEAVIARAHHGSMSKTERALVEDDLKAGRLRCVVATSSLELGVDMGAVDLVVQVAAPPSVAGGLQRVGRAGHQVGEVSRGVFLPQHRGGPARDHGGGRTDAHGWDRAVGDAAQPLGRVGAAGRGDGGHGRLAGGGIGGVGAAGGAVRRVDRLGAGVGVGHGVGPLSLGRVRGAASPCGVGSGGGRAAGAPGRAAVGGDQWRHHPGSGHVRGASGLGYGWAGADAGG